MPSIHKQPGKPFWFCAFSVFDPQTNRNRRLFRSTKSRDKKQALEICRTWHRAALKARSGKLSVDAARDVIARGVSDVFTIANVESLESHTVKSWCETWLQAKAIETEASSHARYARIIVRLLGFLGAKANRDLSALQASDIMRFRDHEALERSRATANLSVKVPRVCFGEAVRQGLLTVNPASRVKLLKSTRESKRRAFTLSEIKRILKACDVSGAVSCSSDSISANGLATWRGSLGAPLTSIAARSRSQRARPGGELCCRSFSRSAITWHRFRRVTIPIHSSSRMRRARSARGR